MEEAALVERVFLRIISTDTDDQFQASLQKFLAPVLLKLASPSEDVRKKVMELLVHVNKRLKSRPQVTLPVDQLLAQYKDPENSNMVTNFSIIYIKMGFPRLPTAEQVSLISEMINLLPGKVSTHQESLISLILPVMKDMTLPGDLSARRQMYGLTEHPGTRAFLLSYMLDVLLLPYSPYFPPPDGPAVVNTPQCPPCFSEVTYKKLAGTAFPSADQIEQMKAGIMLYVTSDIVPVSEVAVHLVIGSADSRHTIATSGDNELRRVSSDINWEETGLVNKLSTIYLGTVNQVRRDKSPPPPKDQLILPAPTRIKAKLFPLLLKSKAAAQLFPQNIQIACDGLAGSGTNAKMKKFAVQFICNISEQSPPAQLKAISPTLLTYLWKVIDGESSASDLKASAYVAIGRMVKQVPILVFDKIDIVSNMFDRLTKEGENQVKMAIQESLTFMAPSLSKANKDVKDFLERLLTQQIESPECAVRRVCVYLAHHCYHTTWLPARYILLLACSDQLVDIRTEASKYLHSTKQVEMPVAEHSFELDLYPTFDEISMYIDSQREERLRSNKTYSRGSNILAFKPETLQQIVEYLRTCLAWSCGVKQPHVKDISDWMEQTPKISGYKPSDRSTNQPAKQPKLNTDCPDVYPSIAQYTRLIIQNIDIQTSVSSVYLLLEMLSLFPSLVKELNIKLDWCKSLVFHYDLTVQTYAAQILAIVASEVDDKPLDVFNEYKNNVKPTSSVEQLNGSLLSMSSLIAYTHQSGRSVGADWTAATSQTVQMLEPMLSDNSKYQVAIQALTQISTYSPLYLEYGSEDSADGEINALFLVTTLSGKVKSSKLESKMREKFALCLGSMGLSDPKFPWRQKCLDGLFESSTTKELELHFTVGQALVTCAQGLDSSERRDKWRQSESEFWQTHSISGPNEMEYLVNNMLDNYIIHLNPHIKQAACIWLLTLVKQSGKFSEVTKRSSDIQSAFMRLLTDNDEITQDIASKGLGVVYDNCSVDQQKELIEDLVNTLMTGKAASKKTGEVSGESKLFTEGSLGSTPEGQGLNTYRELCAIATDLNQPDLIYKFLHLANHQSMWNSRKGAAFGFSTIAAQAGEQLAPYMSQIVPRLYRYTFDPNIKIQTAMRSIWNAVVKETKPTVDKYVREILKDLLDNLTNNQWRVRESCCLAVNDLLRGRQLDDIIDLLPDLWRVVFKLLDDIKESTRNAATAASKTLNKQTIKLCDISYSSSAGEKAISAILPVLLADGITSNVTEVRQLSLDTVVAISKNAGKLLKPHIHTLVPVMLESLSGLENQYLNYVALRVSGQEEIQQRLDKARVAAFKMSPMMDSINQCIQQVDKEVLPELIPRLIDLIKNSIGLGTKVGIASVISSICTQCSLEDIQPFTGKLMAALLNALSDRNATVRKNYAVALSNVCKKAKASSVEKLMERLHSWYLEKDDKSLQEACAVLLKAMVQNCHDTLNSQRSKALPLVFLGMHEVQTHANPGSSYRILSIVLLAQNSAEGEENLWKEIWNEITVGTESAVRLYIQELINITDTALNSNSWHMKAQGASAMGTIAKSIAGSIDSKDLTQLINALLAGLSGRTWNGKEVLLTSLSDIIISTAAMLNSADSPVDKNQIISSSLREAKKESLHYKLPAVKCLAEVVQALETDTYPEFFEIITPYVSDEKKSSDEDVSAKLLLEMKETAYESIGKAWPMSKHQNIQAKHLRSTTHMLTSSLLSVTWREQVAILNSLLTIIERTSIMEISADNWSVEQFISDLFTAIMQVGGDSKYSSVRLAGAKNILKVLQQYKESGRELKADLKSSLDSFLTTSISNDSSLEVRTVGDEIKTFC